MIMTINELLKNKPASQDVILNGWVKTKRGSKNVCFIALNDGSTLKNIQVVIEEELLESSLIKEINTAKN